MVKLPICSVSLPKIIPVRTGLKLCASDFGAIDVILQDFRRIPLNQMSVVIPKRYMYTGLKSDCSKNAKKTTTLTTTRA
jgi:hypothetical protein